MAVIGREIRLKASFFFFLAAFITPPTITARDASSDARAQVTAVAQALSSGNAAEAISHFSKALADYATIRRYFDGLSAFQVENQLSITDEEDSAQSVALTITWDITLTDLGTDKTMRRSSEIHVKLAPVESKWRIVEFAPFDIFNPQVH